MKLIPIVVVDGTVLVATIGATVAAATGVTVLKMGFCWRKKKREMISVTVLNDFLLLFLTIIKKQ